MTCRLQRSSSRSVFCASFQRSAAAAARSDFGPSRREQQGHRHRPPSSSSEGQIANRGRGPPLAGGTGDPWSGSVPVQLFSSPKPHPSLAPKSNHIPGKASNFRSPSSRKRASSGEGTSERSSQHPVFLSRWAVQAHPYHPETRRRLRHSSVAWQTHVHPTNKSRLPFACDPTILPSHILGLFASKVTNKSPACPPSQVTPDHSIATYHVFLSSRAPPTSTPTLLSGVTALFPCQEQS